MDDNEREMNLKLKRIEVCDLLLACCGAMSISRESNSSGQKWKDLHTKLYEMLLEFDARQGA